MKCVLLICGLTLLVNAAYVRSEINEEAAAECAKGFNVEADDAIKELMSKHDELAEEVKCFSKCYMQKVGYMNDDGEIEIDLTFKEIFHDREGHDVSKEKFEAAVEVCSKKHDDKTNCDFAGNAYRCILKELELEE